jgi:hypothetical protein
MNGEDQTLQAFQLGVAQLREAFAGAGIRRGVKPARAMLALAAVAWRAAGRTLEELERIVRAAHEHAVAKIRRGLLERAPAFLHKAPRRFDAGIVRRMADIAGELGHFRALQLVTMAMDDLYLYSGITVERAEEGARNAFAFAASHGLASALAKAQGRLSTSGGDA